MRKRVALAACCAVVLGALAVRIDHAAAAAAPVPTLPTRRTDLIGRTIDLPFAAAGEVSVIVELTGDAVPERVGRAPMMSETAATRAVLREQRSADLALTFAGATVTSRMTQTLNAVTVRIRTSDVARLSRVAGVKGIQVARTVRRANVLADAATGVATAWEDLGLTGSGVTIGVVDDGIDYTHADFGGSGVPADYLANDPTFVENGSFPTAKVVGGWDFVGDDYDADDADLDTPQPDADPLACSEHGTHVSGTAAGYGVDDATGEVYAGPYDAAALAGVSWRVGPGAAPLASLRSYKVFGCIGSTDDAMIVAAIDRAVADHVDVLNLSLGEGLGTGSMVDLVVKAVQRANALGTLVVVAAGNGGNAPYLVATPATANAALAVAAMDAGPATFPGVDVGTTPGIVGVESNDISIGAGVTGPVEVVIPGCDENEYTDVAGKIVVLSDVEGCVSPVFDELAGVLAVVVIVDEYFRVGFLGVEVPFVLVRAADAQPLLDADGSTITLAPGAPVANPALGMAADFSSGGPRRGDSVLKPDIAAPGVSLRSAHAGKGTTAIEISGSSMASPHTAGIAALVAQAHPTWKPSQLKAALMSTADPAAVIAFDPLCSGTGLVGAARATSTVAYLSTTDGRHNVSFGLLSMRSASVTRTKPVRITNTSSAPIVYDLATEFVGPDLGATVTVTPSTVTVPARSSRNVNVRLRIPSTAIPALPGAAVSDFGALVAIRGTVRATPQAPGPGVYPLRIAFAAVPKALSAVAATTRVSGASGGGVITTRNFGKHAGTADVFQWLVRDRTNDNPDREVPDILDVGAKSIPDGDDRQVVFVINTRTAASTHASQAYVISIDVDNDESEDYLLIAGDEGLLQSGVANGTFVTLTLDANTLMVLDAFESEAPFNTSVVYLRTTASSMGANEFTVWNLWVTGTSLLLDDLLQDDAPPTASVAYSPFHPKLVASAAPVVVPPGATVPLAFVVDTTHDQTAKGLLVVTFDDAPGLPTAAPVTVTGI